MRAKFVPEKQIFLNLLTCRMWGNGKTIYFIAYFCYVQTTLLYLRKILFINILSF